MTTDATSVILCAIDVQIAIFAMYKVSYLTFMAYLTFMDSQQLLSTTKTLDTTSLSAPIALSGIVRILSELLVVVRQELSLVGEEA